MSFMWASWWWDHVTTCGSFICVYVSVCERVCVCVCVCACVCASCRLTGGWISLIGLGLDGRCTRTILVKPFPSPHPLPLPPPPCPLFSKTVMTGTPCGWKGHDPLKSCACSVLYAATCILLTCTSCYWGMVVLGRA